LPELRVGIGRQMFPALRPQTRVVISLLVAWCFVVSGAAASCKAGEESQDDGQVVARVGDVPIFQSEIERQLTRVLRDREPSAEALYELRAKATEQLVKRQLVLLYLAKKKLGAIQAEVALAEKRVVAELEQQGLTLDEFLAKTKSNRAVFQRTLAWQIGWPKYLRQYNTDENLERFFRRQPHEFDGSKFHVAHIVWQAKSEDSEVIAGVVAKAENVRKAIDAGDISFAAAAEKHSQSPTASKGGDIGWIRRREPMPESFSQAAFKLSEGRVSPPVVSAVGVHLIHCIEIKKGEKTWQQSRGEITAAATVFLFDWVARQQLSETKLQYTGVMSYYDKEGKRIDP
jgi:parvulin-like peptidyl-prolyl isomerase